MNTESSTTSTFKYSPHYYIMRPLIKTLSVGEVVYVFKYGDQNHEISQSGRQENDQEL